MKITIDNSSNLYLQEQITVQLKTQIITGVLKEMDILPSMRILAKELKVSTITTKRAYEELRKDGFIITIQGKGTFVNINSIDKLREYYLEKIYSDLNQVVDNSKACNMSLNEVVQVLMKIYYK